MIERWFDFFSKYYKWLLWGSLTAYFTRSCIEGLLKGGRWDLYQNVAMADRFLAGQGMYYSAVEASSPYFPGVAYLSALVGAVCFPYRDYILLFMASLVGTGFIYALIKLAEIPKAERLLALIIPVTLVTIGFSNYRSYMNEFKADSLLLLFSLAIAIPIDRMERGKIRFGWKSVAAIFIMSFLMDITKQHCVYVNMALVVYLLLLANLTWKHRLAVISTIVMAGFLSLAVILPIPGVEIQTIKNLSAMPYWAPVDIIKKMGGCFLQHQLYFLLLAVFTYLWAKGRIKLDSMQKKWMLIAVFFGVGQLLGGWKIGGNEGNYEVGMVTFVAFLPAVVQYIINRYVIKERKREITVLLCGLLVVVSLTSFAMAAYKLPKVVAQVKSDASISAYLSEHCAGEPIVYEYNNYMKVIRSKAKPSRDFLSSPYNMDEYRHDKERCLRSKEFRYLYIDTKILQMTDEEVKKYWGEESRQLEALHENYDEVVDPKMPKALQGKIFVIK